MLSDLYTSFTTRPATPKPSRRAPLTPPTVIPPSLNADNPSAAKPMVIPATQVSASTLLARVASSPSSPKQHSPMSSPLPSPVRQNPMERRYSDKTPEHHATQRPGMTRFATMPDFNQQGGGYVSFPDFDLYCQKEHFEGHDSRRSSGDVRS